MNLSSINRRWKSGIVAGICFWVTPFVVFLRFQHYPPTHPETLLCILVLATAGVVSGLLMETGGQYTRAIMFALLITLTADIQIQREDRMGLLAVVGGISLVVCLLARNHLARAGTAILVVLLVVSFVSPTGRVDSRYRFNENVAPGDPSLPTILHIILDEQIGVEGVPAEFDEDGRQARALRDFYLDRNFQVFGRAYSRYDKTETALSRVFNFDSGGYVGGRQLSRDKDGKYYLRENAYFDLLRSRGYQIHVYQTKYFAMCGEKSDENTATCFTYGTEAITSIEGSSLPLRMKMRTVFGVYSRLSTILSLQVPSVRLSAVSAMGILDELLDDVRHARPGSMFIVHLTLPHYPYAYKADCSLRSDPSTWLTLTDRPAADKADKQDTTTEPAQPRKKRRLERNTPETRAERYPLYLEQVACTHNTLGTMFDALDAEGLFDDMVVVVHGDHGSRISLLAPREYRAIADADFVDSFSTMFAVKQPGVAASYDRRVLAVSPLLEAIIQDGQVPDGTDWAGPRQVYIQRAPSKPVRPLPEFGRDLGAYPGNTE